MAEQAEQVEQAGLDATDASPGESGAIKRGRGNRADTPAWFPDGGVPRASVAALVAWAITVAPASLARSSPKYVFALALAALAAGVGGPLLLVQKPKLARHIGISVFLALCALVWFFASAVLQANRVDPLRASIGVIAWGVYALSWNDRWPAAPKDDPEPFAAVLQARQTLPRLAVLLSAIGILSGIGFLFIAFRARETDRALLTHTLSLACAVALISGSATVAISRDKRSGEGSRKFSSQAIRPLLLLLLTLGAGALFWFLVER